MIGRILDKLKASRTEKYISTLRRRGLRLGEKVFLNDGWFLDPSHAYLIEIEDEVTFGPGVMVLAHDASLQNAAKLTKLAPVKIGKRAFIGAKAIILPGTTIGEGAIIGAGAVVKGNVPAYEVWAGNPARRLTSVEETKSRWQAKASRVIPFEELPQREADGSVRELIEKDGAVWVR